MSNQIEICTWKSVKHGKGEKEYPSFAYREHAAHTHTGRFQVQYKAMEAQSNGAVNQRHVLGHSKTLSKHLLLKF